MYVLMWIFPDNILLVILLSLLPHGMPDSCALKNFPVNFPNAVVWVFPDNISLHFSAFYLSVDRRNIMQSLERTASVVNVNHR